MLQNPLFNCKQKNAYPPFKCGLYLEEYFLRKITAEKPNIKRKYIPVLWTNFQIQPWFNAKRRYMQRKLDEWIAANPSEPGYFAVIQHDDGAMLKLPKNTITFGGSQGTYPLPLIYEDTRATLESIPRKTWVEKSTLCSFIGNITADPVMPNVRQEIFNQLSGNPNFRLINSCGWKPDVSKPLQDIFISETVNSRFALAPRGYGRSSFRFFECFQLGTIPVYIWNDINWLPFQHIIDYTRLCIVIHIDQLSELESILLGVDSVAYLAMFEYYDTVKYLFTMEGMSNEIITKINSD
jgi:hypothetical protein